MKVLLVVSNVVLCAIALRLAILDAIASSKAARAKHAEHEGRLLWTVS